MDSCGSRRLANAVNCAKFLPIYLKVSVLHSAVEGQSLPQTRDFAANAPLPFRATAM